MELPDNYILIRKDIKHARLRVSEDGQVRIIAPPTFSDEDIASMLKTKAKWIDTNLKYFNRMSSIELQRNQILLFGTRYNYFYDPTYAHKVIIDHEHKTIRSNKDLLDIKVQKDWYRSLARKHLYKRTKELSIKFKLRYSKFFIRESKTKWGNCSNEKNISLNWKLVKAPDHVIDYIILHELLHTVVMSHTTKFWTLLKAYYPNYKESIQWLERYGNSL
jgi:predicted metal-dependent hydrolase